MDLPFDPSKCIKFLQEPIVCTLVESVANDFFQLYSGKTAAKDEFEFWIGMRETGGPWMGLPEDWRSFFQSFWDSHATREEDKTSLLESLANGTLRPDYPESLQHFLSSCDTFSLDRTCSDIPIISCSVSTKEVVIGSPAAKPITDAGSIKPERNPQGKVKRRGGVKQSKLSNAESAGLSPKKTHEVERFKSTVEQIRTHDTSMSPYIVDVGSGRAHLSRALSHMSFQVLAIDFDASQKVGALKLDAMKPNPESGSVTHVVHRLDETGLVERLESWPTSGENSSLVALHACGDLTVDSLRAFVKVFCENTSRRKMVAVGCCYNLLSPTNFPLSENIKQVTDNTHLLTRSYLVQTPHAPKTWFHSSSHSSSHLISISKLLFRSRIEAELEKLGRRGERQMGRILEHMDYAKYRAVAFERYKISTKEETIPFRKPLCLYAIQGDDENEWAKSVFLFRVFWTLRALIGPVVESILLIDRWLYVVEGLSRNLDTSSSVELVNIFDQATGSLRNVAIVVK